MTISPKELIGTTDVRVADVLDADYILKELEEFNDWFTSDVNLYEDKEYAAKFLDVLIKDHLVMVAEKVNSKGDILYIGFIIGICGPHIYNPQLKTLTELFWWVNPAHRKTKAGLLLMKRFLQWGKENGFDWINATRQANSPVKRETYEKLGFRFQEECYVMEVVNDGSGNNCGNSIGN